MRYRFFPFSVIQIFFFFLMFSLMYTGCSLDYGTTSQAQVQSPEFIFYDVRFIRVENNTAKLQTEAAKLEQYAGIDAMYGEKVHFILYDDRGKISVEGSCALLSADRENELYHFFSGIDIYSREHRARIFADNLRWNEKLQILDSGKRDRVRISMETAGGTQLEAEGTGFIARKKDLSYSFSKGIEGIFFDTKKKEETPKENIQPRTGDETEAQNTEDEEQDV